MNVVLPVAVRETPTPEQQPPRPDPSPSLPDPGAPGIAAAASGTSPATGEEAPAVPQPLTAITRLSAPGPRRSFGQFTVAVPTSSPTSPETRSSTISFTVQKLQKSKPSRAMDPHAYAFKRVQLREKWKKASPTSSRRSVKRTADDDAARPVRKAASEPFLPTLASSVAAPPPRPAAPPSWPFSPAW